MLFEVYSSKDMQYLLQNQFRLRKDQETFKRLLFCACYETGYIFMDDRPNYGFEEMDFFDIYEMIINRIIGYYNPIFEVMDTCCKEVKFEKCNNPYNVYEDFEMMALFAGKLDYEEIEHSDLLKVQESIYVCANCFDFFTMLLGINVILMSDVRGDNTFLSKEYYERIRKISNDYRYFFSRMVDHVFVDHEQTEEYAEIQDVKNLEGQEERTDTKNKVNICFQNVMESFNNILEADTIDPEELSGYRKIILNTLNLLEVDHIEVDKFIDRLTMKLADKEPNDLKYTDKYAAVEKELKGLSSKNRRIHNKNAGYRRVFLYNVY